MSSNRPDPDSTAPSQEGTRWPKVDSQQTTWHPDELAQVLAGLEVDLAAFKQGMQSFTGSLQQHGSASLKAGSWTTVDELQTNLSEAHGQMMVAYQQYVTAYQALVDRFRATANIKKSAEDKAVAAAKAANPTLAYALTLSNGAKPSANNPSTAAPTGKGRPIPS
jgi:hypothetical protein